MKTETVNKMNMEGDIRAAGLSLTQPTESLNLGMEKAKSSVMPRFFSRFIGLSKSRESLCNKQEINEATKTILCGRLSKSTNNLCDIQAAQNRRSTIIQQKSLRGSKSTDNLCYRHADSDPMSKNISMLGERLSRSTDNMCHRQEEQISKSKLFPVISERLSKSAENWCPRNEENSENTNTFPKVSERFSRSVNNLCSGDEKDDITPSILSRVTNIIRTHAFKRKSENKENENTIPENHGADFSVGDNETDDKGDVNDNNSYSSVCQARSYNDELYGYKDIRTSHYIQTSERKTCSNTCCSAVFSFYVHPHHCRRCGEVFCSNCLQLRRKLNRLALPDPDGLPCKVCETCFHESDEADQVTIRSLTEEFTDTRAAARTEKSKIYCEMTVERKLTSGMHVPACWREQFKIDITQECHRLLEGFSAAVRNSERYVHKTIQELRKLVEVPAWQKSVFWALEKTTTNCRLCHSRFRKFHKQQKLRNCRVCGLALCKTCSNKELLVYFDNGDAQNIDKRPKISVIKFDGSPEVEPELSVLLYVCTDCKAEVLKRQLEDSKWFEEKPKTIDVMSQVIKLHEEVTAIQETIKEKEIEVQRLVQEMEQKLQNQAHGTLLYLALNLHRHTMPLDSNVLEQIDSGLGKIEAGLSEFPGYINKFKDLLKCDANTGKAGTLLKNLIKSKCDFYFQHKQIFTDLGRKTGSL